jgi:hypothetical protein
LLRVTVSLPNGHARLRRVRPSAAFTTGRRYDDTTFRNGRAFGALTKTTKLTKPHKESLVSLFDGLQPLPAPRQRRP